MYGDGCGDQSRSDSVLLVCDTERPLLLGDAYRCCGESIELSEPKQTDILCGITSGYGCMMCSWTSPGR